MENCGVLEWKELQMSKTRMVMELDTTSALYYLGFLPSLGRFGSHVFISAFSFYLSSYTAIFVNGRGLGYCLPGLIRVNPATFHSIG